MTTLNDRFKLLTGIESVSGSNSDLWLVEDRQQRRQYIMKVFPDRLFKSSLDGNDVVEIKPLNEKNNSLFYELQMYLLIRKHLIENIVVNCRNALCIAGNGHFSLEELKKFISSSVNGSKLSSHELENNILYNAKYIMDLLPTKRLDNNVVEFPVRKSITEKSNTGSGSVRTPLERRLLNGEFKYECIITPKIGQDGIKNLDHFFVDLKTTMAKKDLIQTVYNYLFIIICTIVIMASNGFNQNDLHYGNIILDPSYLGENSKYKKKYFIIIDSTLLLIDNNYTPFIFDFDRSTYTKSANAMLEKDPYFKKIGTCPNFHPQRDMLKFLCETYHVANKYKIPQISDDITNHLVKSSFLSTFSGLTSENGQEIQCRFHMDDNVSLTCKKDMISREFVSNEKCLAWALQRCGFKQFDLRDIYNNKNPNDLKLLKDWFTSDLPLNWEKLSEPELKDYIIMNTQIIRPVSIENHTRFVNFFYSKCLLEEPNTLSEKIKARIYQTKESLKKSYMKSKERFMRKKKYHAV